MITDGHERKVAHSAIRLYAIAAIREGTSGRKVIDCGGQACDGFQAPPPTAKFRHAGHQTHGVGMFWGVENCAGLSLLHDPACIHHRHPSQS